VEEKKAVEEEEEEEEEVDIDDEFAGNFGRKWQLWHFWERTWNICWEEGELCRTTECSRLPSSSSSFPSSNNYFRGFYILNKWQKNVVFKLVRNRRRAKAKINFIKGGGGFV
jgi:hypothetical protein